jgi:NADH-quinone oxidoreductase subunit C
MSHPVDLSWAESFKASLGPALIACRESAPGELEFTIAKDHSVEALRQLKTLVDGAFDHLADLTAYDAKPANKPRYHVVYELISMLRKQRCSVIVPADADKADAEPSVRSIVSLWPGANWLEREVFDLLGIQFEGHPDHRRILLPEAFKGHPLRKDFIVDLRQSFPEAASDEGIFDPFGNTLIRGEKT